MVFDCPNMGAEFPFYLSHTVDTLVPDCVTKVALQALRHHHTLLNGQRGGGGRVHMANKSVHFPGFQHDTSFPGEG